MTALDWILFSLMGIALGSVVSCAVVMVADYRQDKEAKRPITGKPEKRAQQLLKRTLGQRAFDSYMKNGKVIVETRAGNMWLIAPDHAVKFKAPLVNGDCYPDEQYCVYPLDAGSTPLADQVLTIAMHLLADESKFLSTANLQRRY